MYKNTKLNEVWSFEEKLNEINITNYKFIVSVSNNNGRHKGAVQLKTRIHSYPNILLSVNKA